MFKNSSYYKGTNKGFWSGYALVDLGVVTGGDSGFGVLNVDGEKCVKFKDLSTKNVQRPFYLQITEKIAAGSSRAHTIEARYYYKITSDSALTYQVVGTWDNLGNNVNESAYANFHYNANPYSILNTDVYTGYLALWCGTTNVNQTWKYRIRMQEGDWGNTGTWGPWVEYGKGTSALVRFNVIEGENTFVESMRIHNGIEFYID